MQTIAAFLIAALVSVGAASQPDQVVNTAPVVENVANNPHQFVPQPSQIVPSPEYVAQPAVVIGHEQPHVNIEHPVIGHYAPTPIAGDQVKPVVHGHEQYGQPESASIPPNYKPFGSWGLYIGGSPQDGYYTNYYKSLSGNSVDKVPSNGAPQSVGYSPIAYSPSEFTSGAPVSAGPVYAQPPNVGSQFYSSPSFFEQPEFYATKRYQQGNKPLPTASGVKGNNKSGTKASPVAVGQYNQQYQQNGQIVPYSVPVGSQIVGSQPGVEGSFAPYGVHGFTRYAVKPTYVNQGPYYHSVPAVEQGVSYQKPQSQIVPQHQPLYSFVHPPINSVSLYPYNYYGYPINHIYGNSYPSSQVTPVQGVSHAVHVASPVSPVVNQEVPQIPLQQQSPVSPVQAGQQAGLAQASATAHDQQQQEQSLDKPDKNDGYATKQ